MNMPGIRPDSPSLAGEAGEMPWPARPHRMLIALLCLLAFALPTAVAYVTLQMHERHEQNLAVAGSRKLALALASSFDRTVDAIDTVLNAVPVAIADQPPDEIYLYLREAKLPAGVIQLSFIDRNGLFIASNLSPPGKTLDLSDREHIRAHLRDDPSDRGVLLSKPVKGRISGTWSIQFSRALRKEDGTLIGLVVASYEISSFINFYEQLRPDGAGFVALIGDDGAVRASAPGFDQLTGLAATGILPPPAAGPGTPAMPPEGTMSGVDDKGIRRTGHYVHSSRYPFFVLVATDDAAVLDQSRNFSLGIIAMAVVLGLTLLAFASFGMRYWKLQSAYRVKALQAFARQREAHVLQAISRVPGITVLHVERGQTTRIGDGQQGELPDLIAERVATPEFLTRLNGDDSSVSIEHFSGAEQEFEVEVVVARLDEERGHGAEARRSEIPTAVVFAVDETAKRMEEHKLYQMSKMASLGELVTGLAHEINQPLGVIRLAANNALGGLRKGLPIEHTSEKLERIIRQVDRMKAIIDHMRIFGRRSARIPDPSSARAAIAGTTQVLGTDMKLDGIELATEDGDDARLDCAQEQLEQVLVNLVLNARDAIRERRRQDADLAGRIEIALNRTSIDGRPHARLTVTDNGGGIPQAVLDKIFQPFFTTKPPGKGTGLGLSVSFGIIRDYGGTISGANVGDGAQFTILLPEAAAKPAIMAESA
ncbi:ATP-binding protein [Starkeya koreensis]|uniref:histidine kinase n=1 Tax=Ancylobacter koreensis TaxID=266121 RepID=A0ABT0DKT0_9HYPH|nr:ATP-binding protein [Ancylobacter koreensis]MCK0207885.1 ATP-binding protein [Ancylobacter koreensis]